jgi:hypothetical protein
VSLRVHRLARERGDLHAVRMGLVDHVLRRRSESVRDQRDWVRERDLDLAVRDLVGPAQHPARLLALRQRRQVESLHELVDVAPVVCIDHRADLR